MILACQIKQPHRGASEANDKVVVEEEEGEQEREIEAYGLPNINNTERK